MDFFCEDTDFLPAHQDLLTLWVEGVIRSEGKIPGAIGIILCSDEYLLRMNIEHLQHDYYTDIITFDYCEGSVVSGDLFISVDRVRDNASQLKVRFEDELHRVMIHGVLHLLGFGDKSEDQQRLIRQKEDESLGLLQVPS